jgi:hypothetical protein
MRRILLVAGLLLAPAALAAQETPEQVVQRYFDTFRDGDFAANAAMMDTAALSELKTMMVGLSDATGVAANETQAHLRETFGVQNTAELRALAPAVLYERMLRSVPGQGNVREFLAGARVNALGHVLEGDTAHVVYRMSMEVMGNAIDQVQVSPVRRVDGQWRVLLTGSFAAMINSMSAAGIEHD